jgi:hypothetical protein
MQVGQPVLLKTPIEAGIIGGTAICRLHTIAPIKMREEINAISDGGF